MDAKTQRYGSHAIAIKKRIEIVSSVGVRLLESKNIGASAGQSHGYDAPVALLQPRRLAFPCRCL